MFSDISVFWSVSSFFLSIEIVVGMAISNPTITDPIPKALQISTPKDSQPQKSYLITELLQNTIIGV